jgi:hypothetical protein
MASEGCHLRICIDIDMTCTMNVKRISSLQRLAQIILGLMRIIKTQEKNLTIQPAKKISVSVRGFKG